MENKAVCLGIIVGDFIGRPVDAIPEKGKLVLTERTELHIGGCASNTAVVLKRLGVDVSIIGNTISHIAVVCKFIGSDIARL